MKIPLVLPSTEHAWLFKLMQPIKAILQVKENLQTDLGREPTDSEIAEATNIDASELWKNLEVGRATRNKLIKHNLRLVLFVMNKYFQDFANGSRFQDLCQAGVEGLITAIDDLNLIGSSVPFGLEYIRVEIQKAKLELLFELQRMPTDEEIIESRTVT
ncbi:hypothetical protein K7X08_035260 [Anisodus acutangulus]|uniref:RNA polymerase sigma-70 region 3 domain-containing protein n=1 Tax=Anisodus acutangulus TaxID=402998 RepID=A0A9Q1LH89_9SOLA|nr:hypothetical protein K7X08_035260 [Anisodus acutangulus]